MSATVALVKCSTYEEKELREAVSKVFLLIPLPEVEGKKILLKPNILSDAPPERAVTTRAEVVREVIYYLQDAGAEEILIGDSPGVPKPGFSAKKCGIESVIENTKAKWVDFSREKVTIHSQSGKVQKEFKVSAFVTEVDIIISLPKLKTHQLMYFTGAVKNLFGVVPGLAKSTYHVRYPDRERFAEMLIDLLEALKPSYALMDGVIAMEGAGPGNGTPYPAKVILGSTNLPAMDFVASSIIGYNPMEVPANRAAIKRGWGFANIDDIEIKGLPLEVVKINNFTLIPLKKHKNIVFDLFKTSRFLQKLQMKRKPKPYFLEEKCIKCGECIKICASNANWFEEGEKGKYVAVDYNKCIRCYCCHEVCPVDAIEIK